MKPYKWTPAEVGKVVRMYNEGVRVDTIAEVMDKRFQQIASLIRREVMAGRLKRRILYQPKGKASPALKKAVQAHPGDIYVLPKLPDNSELKTANFTFRATHIAAVLKFAAEGKAPSVIAARYGCSVDDVMEVLTRWKSYMPRPDGG